MKIDGNWISQKATCSFVSWKYKESGWTKIVDMAKVMQNDHLWHKVNGVDLFAANAHFHDYCYHNFFTDVNLIRDQENENVKEDTEHSRICAAHKKAYESVLKIVKERIINKNKILLLRDIRNQYIHELEQQSAPSPKYKSDRLMEKMKKDDDISDKVSFSKVKLTQHGCVSFWLVFSSCIKLSDAVTSAYLAGTKAYLKIQQ